MEFFLYKALAFEMLHTGKFPLYNLWNKKGRTKLDDRNIVEYMFILNYIVAIFPEFLTTGIARYPGIVHTWFEV